MRSSRDGTGRRRRLGARRGAMLLLAGLAVGLPAGRGQAMEVRVLGYERRTIYHSPQTPGFTSWAGLWIMPDKSVMVCFTQATGPVAGWRAKAPKAVRRRLGWPPAGHEGYDMTGLALDNVHLRSTDRGKTWEKVSADPFVSCMNGCTGEGEVALADGTVLRSVWGQYLPYWDVPQTGYIQRSTDGTKTWGPPEVLSADPSLLTFPKRVRVLADGRVVVTGAAAPYDPANWAMSGISPKLRPCLWASEDKAGKAWTGPLYVVPEGSDCSGEEFDVAELPGGDLLAVFRVAVKGKPVEERRQSVLARKGNTWEPGALQMTPFRHSGHPELLATREGLVLHVATDGTWWTADRGAHWAKLDLPGSAYYPRSVQLDDGTILAVGHAGSDDAYGAVDQSIILDTYRLQARP